MRLIDADALMKEFAEFVKDSNNSDFADVPTWNDAVSLVGSVPTIDAVPVVRCKDCKYADKYHHCERLLIWTTAEDFCSRGERKDG